MLYDKIEINDDLRLESCRRYIKKETGLELDNGFLQFATYPTFNKLKKIHFFRFYHINLEKYFIFILDLDFDYKLFSCINQLIFEDKIKGVFRNVVIQTEKDSVEQYFKEVECYFITEENIRNKITIYKTNISFKTSFLNFIKNNQKIKEETLEKFIAFSNISFKEFYRNQFETFEINDFYKETESNKSFL